MPSGEAQRLSKRARRQRKTGDGVMSYAESREHRLKRTRFHRAAGKSCRRFDRSIISVEIPSLRRSLMCQRVGPARRLMMAALAAAGSIWLTAHASAQVADRWPSRQVALVIPFAPGGSNDVIGRALAQRLASRLGQPVVVENRAGAGSVVGASHVARSAPDGYTLMFVSGSIGTTAAVQQTPYDAATAFDGIARVAAAPFVFMVREGFPARTIPELVAYAKANPGKMTYGSAGLGDSTQLATELFNLVTGVRMTGVNYKGIAPAQLDLVGGRLDLVVTTIASVRGTVTEKLPMLAVTSSQRSADAPNVPTVRESGIDYVVDVWWGLFGPAGLPSEIRNRVNMMVRDILAEQDFVAFLRNAGATQAPSAPDELNEVLRRDIALWRKTVDAAGLRQK
jgi:tripartite-type tricarboxylate transporter receptor subunit TctC